MGDNFRESLRELNNYVLAIGRKVENGIKKSIKALEEGNIELATEVIIEDKHIDEMELILEERSTRLISLHQPKDKDLRMVIVISKILTDLERIGDHAANIAEKVIDINGEELQISIDEIIDMSNLAISRFRESLDAFVNMDVKIAKKVAREDERLDTMDEDILQKMTAYMSGEKALVKQATALMFIGRFLERIGDHSTNICERVIYMASGEREIY
ncbi:phosphate signaling complex protein PhoU [Natronospora cellulosivora (SeqCode)]